MILHFYDYDCYNIKLQCRANISYPAKNKNSRYNNLPANTDSPADVTESNHNTAKVSQTFLSSLLIS